MRAILSCRFLLVLFLSAVGIVPSLLSAAQKTHRASVHFLARGTAIYSSFSGSQSEYLVRLQTANQTPFLARLLYRRPLQHPEIPDALIDSGQWNNLRVTRAPDCDQDYATLSTVWLPIGYGSLRGEPGLRFIAGAEKPVLAGDVVLPCYLVLPRDVRWNQRYKQGSASSSH